MRWNRRRILFIRRILPESFNPMFRKYGYRMVKEHTPFQVTFQNADELFRTEHDPMKELGVSLCI